MAAESPEGRMVMVTPDALSNESFVFLPIRPQESSLADRQQANFLDGTHVRGPQPGCTLHLQNGGEDGG